MLKIIATIEWLGAFAQRIADLLQNAALALDDIRERAVGLALTATSEGLVDNAIKLAQVKGMQMARAQDVSDKLREDLRKAYDAHSAALNTIGVQMDQQRDKLAVKRSALAARKALLRSKLAPGAVND